MTLHETVLVVRSVTDAIKGQKVLESGGINAYVQRNTSPTTRQGCGYGLKINGNTQTAINMLTNAGVKVVEIQEVVS